MKHNVPTFRQMMPNVMNALRSFGDETSISDINDFVYSELKIKQEDKYSCKRKLEWSRDFLRRFGLIINTRPGYWKVRSEYLICDSKIISSIIEEENKKYISENSPRE